MIKGNQEATIKFIEQDLQRKKSVQPVTLVVLVFGTMLFPMILGLGLRESIAGAFEPRIFLPNILAVLLVSSAASMIYGKRFSSRKAFKWLWPILMLSMLLATERIVLPIGIRTVYASSSQFWVENMRCFLKGALSSAITGTWLTLSAFLFFPWPSRRYRAVISIIAGVSGTIMLGFHCDSSSAGHVLISHFGQGVILGMFLFQIQELIFRLGLRAGFPNLLVRIKRPGRIA